MSPFFVWSSLVLLCCLTSARADDKPFAGVIPRAQQQIKIDGSLAEWTGAFVTPLNATHPDLFNRAAQIYYLWDDQALYIGKRALDASPIHVAPDSQLYDGDAVEFYLDTREGAALGNPEFQPRTLHMFFTALTGRDFKPRYGVRSLPVFSGLKLQGVEMAAAKTSDGYTLEFKLPWSNFPGFTPRAETPLGIDVEVCSADDARRVFRTFAFSSPQSVQTPAAFGRMKLVDRLSPNTLVEYSRALMPVDAQLPGNYGWVYVSASLSPTIARQVGKVAARLLDSQMKVRKTAQTIQTKSVADHWTQVRSEIEVFDLAPGEYTLIVTAFSPAGTAIVERSMKLAIPP
jgi:hypothetical protein